MDYRGCSAWDLKKFGPEQMHHLKQTLELACERQLVVEPSIDPRVEQLGDSLDASVGSFKQWSVMPSANNAQPHAWCMRA